MITGIEVAGLALGAFPLIIEGLKFYISEGGTMRTLWEPKEKLQRLKLQVQLEYTKFRNTIENLFQDVVDEDQLRELTMGDGWEEEDLVEKLMAQLDGKAYIVDVVVQVIEAIHVNLRSLIGTLGLVVPQENQRTATGSIKDHWAEIKIVLLSTDLCQMLVDIDKHNRDLDMLVRSALSSSNYKSAPEYHRGQRIKHHDKDGDYLSTYHQDLCSKPFEWILRKTRVYGHSRSAWNYSALSFDSRDTSMARGTTWSMNTGLNEAFSNMSVLSLSVPMSTQENQSIRSPRLKHSPASSVLTNSI